MQSFSFCLLRHMSFLADKIRAKLFLGIRIRNARFFACFKATHHPDHIFARLRIVCIPSSSFGASSAVSPCTIFQ